MTFPPLPPLLLSAALGVWGWQTGLWGWALLLALPLEAARWLPWRWAWRERDARRVVGLTNMLLLAALLYQLTQYLGQGPLSGHLFNLISWLPLVLSPLVLAERYANPPGVRFQLLLLWPRPGNNPANPWRIELGYPYVIVCLLAAGMGQHAGYAYGAAGVVLYLLWVARSRRHRVSHWALLATLGCGVAFPLMPGLQKLQLQVEEYSSQWILDYLIDRDPYRSYTAIGDIGSLKRSERILLWVKPEGKLPLGELRLRQASFNAYFDTTWRATGAAFVTHNPESDRRSWLFAEAASSGSRATITLKLRRGKAVLPLPLGTDHLRELPAGRLQRNALGAVRITEGPGLIRYTASYGQATPLDSVPEPQDLAVPVNERPVMEALTDELRLQQLTPAERVRAIERFFQGHFAYTLQLPRTHDASLTPLGNFLRHARAGHCEYFATATVLLLRAAGIPTRYASGYSVQEYSEFEDAYVVRRRHAHAWALAYVDGRWRDVDTTPATWLDYEENLTPWWQPLNGLWDKLRYLIAEWRLRDNERLWEDLLEILMALAGGALIALGWRFRRRWLIWRWSKSAKSKPPPGHDSPLFQILNTLERQGITRQSGESLRYFLRRSQLLDTPGMGELVALHQRYRFDPEGISVRERQQLDRAVNRWLRNWKGQGFVGN